MNDLEFAFSQNKFLACDFCVLPQCNTRACMRVPVLIWINWIENVGTHHFYIVTTFNATSRIYAYLYNRPKSTFIDHQPINLVNFTHNTQYLYYYAVCVYILCLWSTYVNTNVITRTEKFLGAFGSIYFSNREQIKGFFNMNVLY